MNGRICSLIILCFTVSVLAAQNDETLITIGNTKIGLEEFERIYKKNNSNLYTEEDKKSPEDYLELFVNFKLKVIEAENEKLDTSMAFINELKGYRKELAAPYLTDTNFEEELAEKIYDRMTKEISASHILFDVPPDTSVATEKAALEEALKVRSEILAGKDFNEMAVDYSDDPSVQTNGGNLGYFTAFQLVAPFEDVAYNTPIGEISDPVRTTFGYHLIKVNDIRPNKGEIKVAHIMKMFPQNGMTNEVKSKLKNEIDSIYLLLKNGADFTELAKKYSDDKNSAAQGGEMPWFSSGKIIPEFSNPAFDLKNIGDITEPVETPYGYHIIKKLDQKSIPPFEEIKSEIENRIKSDPERSTTSQKSFTDKLKKEYNFIENQENIESLKSLQVAKTISNKPAFTLFTIDNKEYKFADLEHYISENNNQNQHTYFDYYDNWVNSEIINLEDSKLEEKYPEFRYMMKEYHDGILLFNISKEKIWNYAAEDSAGLEKYYKKHKRNYKWNERFKGYLVICNNPEIREQAEMYFAEGMKGTEVSDIINQGENKINITEGAWEKGENPIVDYYVWNGPAPEYFVDENTFIRGDVVSSEPKSLKEARGLYLADYQNYLEKKWLKELHKKYKIRVNHKLLKTIPGV